MPAEGSTPRLPFAGVIFRSASSAACALADAAAAADAEALAAAGEGALPPHAVASRPMAAPVAMVPYHCARRAHLRSVPRTVTLLCAGVRAQGAATRFLHRIVRAAYPGERVTDVMRPSPLQTPEPSRRLRGSGYRRPGTFAARPGPKQSPGEREHGEHDDHVLRPGADPVRQRAVAHQRHPGVEDRLLPDAAVRDQRAVRRDDRALAGGRGVHHGAVAFDGPDPGHRRLLLGLAELAVDLEVRVVGLHREQVRPGRDLGPHHVVEAHLVADHVAELDLPDVEDDGRMARGEVGRLQRREGTEAGDEAAERDVLAKRYQLALDVDRGRDDP